MTQPIIEVRKLSKRYSLGALGAQTLRDEAELLWNRWFRKNGSSTNESTNQEPKTKGKRDFWALRDVFFDVQPGEVVGIIGRNGAGKSTLLKILSRITEPTEGEVIIRGRVASLLEIGTGFHPELSGRDNIYLNGAILGMKKREIDRKFDEIVAFAEVEQFIDTPVKRYSSGMYVRLAFAVAAHLEPEILIVDEVLAVGDAAFQKKCLGRMTLASQEGKTVLFVSHNMTAVRSLCSRGMLLRAGEICMDDNVDACIRAYMEPDGSMPSKIRWDNLSDAPGNESVRLRSVATRALREAAESEDELDLQTAFDIEVVYQILKPGKKLHVTLVFYTDEGTVAFTSGSCVEKGWEYYEREVGCYRSVCHIPSNLFNEGTYSILLLIVEDRCRVILSVPEVIRFEIKDLSPRDVGSWHGREPGPVKPKLDWSNTLLSGDRIR